MPEPHEVLDARTRAAIAALPERGAPGDPAAPVREGSRLTGAAALALFDAQAQSRQLDLEARRMRARGEGFYTIGSAGHEGDAAVAAALRPTDPALLHYRSGGFFAARAQQVEGVDGVRAVLRSLAASTLDPGSGGRHKVFGHPELAIVPQTSTIASHLPRAVGVAFAIDRARTLGLGSRWPRDAVAVTSFGDASVNHSTAVGAFNTLGHAVHQGVPMPLLLVCEDNGLGISVRTPTGWTARMLSSRPGIDYVAADGCDAAEAYDAAIDAVDQVRRRRRPVVLHLRTVRFLGHAGSDLESAYRATADIEAELELDPVAHTAALLAAAGVCTAAELVERYDAIGHRVAQVAAEVGREPRFTTRSEVMAPLTATDAGAVRRTAAAAASEARRREVFGATLPEDEGPLTLAASINRALSDVLAAHDEALLFGEDVAHKGGVYGLTRGLLKRFGRRRVFDTLLDEQAILGLALGAGLSGLLPLPEIQYLAYLHNAEDQIRGEGASQAFFSAGSYRNPMVVRIAGYGYQQGFGGHFHNDDAVAVLRDVPGIVVATPALPDDAGPMLRACVGAALAEGRVAVFLEPIALYHQRDLHSPGDNGWLRPYAGPDRWSDDHAAVGSARVHGDGDDLTIVTSGNGVRMSLRVAERLARQGVRARVLDLRWLVPLPVEDVVREAAATGRVLVVDETRRSAGVGEGVVAALVDAGFDGPLARVASADSYIPLGAAADLVLLSEPEIESAAAAVAARPR